MSHHLGWGKQRRGLRASDWPALGVALSFVAFATTWIFGSDAILNALISDPLVLSNMQTAKGIAFVIATGVVIFYLVRFQMRAALRANHTLRESMERLRFITEHAEVGHWHWDMTTGQLDWTAISKRLFGIPVNEVVTYERFLNAVHPDDREYVFGVVGACLVNPDDGAYHIEFRSVWPDGTERWLEAFGRATFDGSRPVRMAGITFDITDRIRAQNLLHASEARHRSVVEATGAVTWSCPPDGRHIAPQPAWMAFTGQSGDEMLGSGWSNVIHPDDVGELTKSWSKSIASGTAFTGVSRYRRHDGQWRWMSVYAAPVHDAGGRIVEWFGMNIDITERKDLELRLEDALAAANAASEAKSDFVANMSHEMRTPMGSVIGMLEILLRTELKPAQQAHAQTALNSARDLMHVLNDVLDESAIEAGKVSIETQPFEISALLAEALSLFSLRAAQKGLALTVTCGPGAPPWILGDERRLRQILNNLIGNAVKYTDKGSIAVLARYDASRSVMSFEVRDTGIGIAEEIQPRLFQPFYQADARISRRYEGSGLGLAISRQLVELMNGQIGVSSRQGDGSTFWFEVPAPECAAPADDEAAAPEEEALPSMRVLVAEDNPTTQQIIRSLLEALGHHVTLVDDGGPAVATAASGKFDVILMDVMMPGMDGSAATRRIRELGGRAGGVPIIALTADVLFGKDGKYLAAGMTDFVSKPIDVRLLHAALKRAAARADGDR